jgi:hypothetical protein
MEQSRTRTLLGLALVLVGSILLFRTALAPVGTLGASISDDRPAAWSAQQEKQEALLAQQEAQREMQQDQQEALLAQQEAQHEMQQDQQEALLAQQEAQREMQQAQHEAQREISGSTSASAPFPELPAMPPLPPLPPLPPEPPAFHLGIWPSPAVLLIALGIFLFSWHRRTDRSPHRV